VVADFVHVGAFKGAAEPLTRREPSKEMLATLDAIIQQIYDSMITGLADRGFSRDDAIKTIDTGMFFADAAVTAKLDRHRRHLGGVSRREHRGRPVVAHEAQGERRPGGFDLEKLQVFLGMMPTKRPSEPHVALVYAVGNIIDGRGGGLIGARNEIAGHTLSPRCTTSPPTTRSPRSCCA
jgi:protease-4